MTTAIAIAHVDSWGKRGEPHATIQAAVCHVCDDWAVLGWEAVARDYRGDRAVLATHEVAEVVTVVRFACAAHSDEVANRMLDVYGGVHSASDDHTDELVRRVGTIQRRAEL